VVVHDTANQLDTGNFFLTSINEDAVGWAGGTYWAFIIDRDARVVWYQRTPSNNWTLYTQVAQSGDHLLIDEATAWSDWDDGAGSIIHRTYLDQYIEGIPAPGLHHAFVQKPDGTLVWGSQDHGNGERLVERDPVTGDETVVWACPNNWFNWYGSCESNSMYWDENRGTYLYSFYTNNTMSELDPTTGENIWWAGEEPGGFDFIPANSQFSWQHGINWTPQGTLLVSTEGGQPVTTWLREYIVDEQAETLTEVWSFDSGVRADTNGDARRLANDNTLHVVGSASQIIEVAPSGDPVWRVEYTYDKLMGRGEFIEDLYTLVSPNPVAP